MSVPHLSNLFKLVIFDYNYFNNTSFISLGLLSVSTYLPDIGESMGLSRGEAIFLLSISGIASTVARILTGLLTNQPWADCIIINCIVMLLLGGASVASPHCRSHALLVAYSCTVGATTGSFWAVLTYFF